MRRAILAIPLVVCFLSAAEGQNWSVSAATGPFVFGHFAERTVVIGNENGTTATRSRLSAATRPGGAADIERDFGRWLAVRLEAAWTRAPLSIKSSSGSSGVSLDAGDVSVTTLLVPLVVHLNRGTFRFQVMGGPAYALYNIHRPTGAGVTPLFEGTRGRLGAAGGAGVSWWWSQRLGVEWQVAGIVTGSPFHIEDVAPTSKGVRILKPQNGHTTIGIRYRF